MEQFGVTDIEGSKWKIFLGLGYYDIFNNEYHEFLGANGIQEFLSFVFSDKCFQKKIYAHFGGIYDHLFFIDGALRNSKYIIGNMIINGRRVLKIDIKKGKKKISFVDSSGLFPFSLKRLGIAFDVEHKKLDEDVTLFDKVTPKMRRYMKQDCYCLAEALKKYSEQEYIKDIGLSLTRSGQSFKIYSDYFNDELGNVPDKVQDFARKALYGGRTEIIKPMFKGKNKKDTLKVYDFTSLYPSVQYENKFPGDFSHWSTSLDVHNFSISDVLIECPKNIKLPFLPCKLSGKLYFPVGEFRGVYTNVELKKALSLGYKVHKVFKTAHFKDAGFVFKEFIDKFFKLRLKNKDNEMLKIFYKDVMNHLWGRLVMNLERDTLSFDIKSMGKIHSKFFIDDYEVRTYQFTKKIFSDVNVVLGLFVPAYGRIKLYEGAEKLDFDVHYMDTDSLFTRKSIPKAKDDVLGVLKLEYEMKEFYALQPKAYAGVKIDRKMICKTKGIRYPQDQTPLHTGTWTLKDFEASLEGEIKLAKIEQKRGLAGLKTAMKKGEILHVLPDNLKGINKRDEKRIWKKIDGEILTFPHEFSYKNDENIIMTLEHNRQLSLF